MCLSRCLSKNKNFLSCGRYNSIQNYQWYYLPLNSNLFFPIYGYMKNRLKPLCQSIELDMVDSTTPFSDKLATMCRHLYASHNRLLSLTSVSMRDWETPSCNRSTIWTQLSNSFLKDKPALFVKKSKSVSRIFGNLLIPLLTPLWFSLLDLSSLLYMSSEIYLGIIFL